MNSNQKEAVIQLFEDIKIGIEELQDGMENEPAARGSGKTAEIRKISPYMMQEAVSGAMDLLASRALCTGEHTWEREWDGDDIVRHCVKCGFFELVQKEHQS